MANEEYYRRTRELLDEFKKDSHFPSGEVGRREFEKYYQWSREDAIEAQKEWELSNSIVLFERGPLMQWAGVRVLLDLYADYVLDGDESVVLKGLYHCSLSGLPIPAWLGALYCSFYRDVKRYKAKTWDDVFGRPHPKGTNLSAKRKWSKLSLKVYRRVKQIKENRPSIPIDSLLFEDVGKEFNLGKTLTEEYYYSAKKMLKDLL